VRFFAGQGLSTDFAADAREAEIAAQRALSLDPADALVHAVAGHVRSFLLKQPEHAVEMFERALQLNPNSSFAWGLSASTYCFLVAPKRRGSVCAMPSASVRSIRMNFFFLTVAGVAEFVAGRYEEAMIWLQKARSENSRFTPMHCTRAASLGCWADTKRRKLRRRISWRWILAFACPCCVLVSTATAGRSSTIGEG